MMINIIDAGCGIGKTTALINKIDNDFSDKNYLFVTPYLNEVNRIKSSCKNRTFFSPSGEDGRKIDNLKELVSEKKDVVITHSLFGNINELNFDFRLFKNYILIIDETIETIKEIRISKYDLKMLIKNCAKEIENKIVWTQEKYVGKFSLYKDFIDTGNVYYYGNGKGDIVSLIWMISDKLLYSFSDIYLSTYMFDAQIQKKCFDLYGFNYKKWYIKDFTLTEETQVYDYSKQKEKIDIYKDIKYYVKKDRFYLSLGWIMKNMANKEEISKIKREVYTFVRSYCKASSSDVLWTTFKEYKDLFKGKGYTSGFASINAKATNEYADKSAIVYIGNRYFNPVLRNFLIKKGITFEDDFEDKFALSELIQFIYRSRIRKEKDIKVCIPAERMRWLLHEWKKKSND